MPNSTQNGGHDDDDNKPDEMQWSPPVTVTASPPSDPGSPPITVTALPLGDPGSPPITVTASPPSYSSSGSDQPADPGSPPVTVTASPPPSNGCPPALPSVEWARNNEKVKAALKKAGADLAGVKRAIDHWDTIKSAANKHKVDPALLAAIGIRETDFRNIDQKNGLGRGVFQIDMGQNHHITADQAHDINIAANVAAAILADNAAFVAAHFFDYEPEEQLQATAAIYNMSRRHLTQDPDMIDRHTTGHNYGSNVMDLMEAFKDPITGLTPKATSENGGRDGC